MSEFDPNVDKMRLIELKKRLLTECQLQLYLAPEEKIRPRYLASFTHFRITLFTTIGPQEMLKRFPILKQQDFSKLICRSSSHKIEQHLSINNCKSVTVELSRIIT